MPYVTVTPVKRFRFEMSENSDKTREELSLVAQLEQYKSEVESVTIKKSSGKEVTSYVPTYRAVLAQHGLLVKDTLGTGSYSKVKFANCLAGPWEKVAVKIINRTKAPKDFQNRFLPRELAIWPKLKHPNIVSMLGCFYDNRFVYMILEYAPNGDVLRYIQTKGALPEPTARAWAMQVCDAVRYLHDRDITHRDLKLENLLLDTGHNIKVCDFGFVKGDCTKEFSKTYCGSKSYAAPEILAGKPYDPKKSDVWALGVIIYIFVTGKMPFDESRGNAGVLEEHRKLAFPWHKFKDLSEECKDLIHYLFRYDFSERPTLQNAISHIWFKPPKNARKDSMANRASNRGSSKETKSVESSASKPTDVAAEKSSPRSPQSAESSPAAPGEKKSSSGRTSIKKPTP